MSLNVSHLVVNGIHFVKIGRLTFSFCIARRYRALPPTAVPRIRGARI